MARHTASRMVDLPAPVGPVMAKSPAPLSGSAVKSMEKGWTRLASPSPAMRRMRMRSALFPRRREGPQMNFTWHDLVAGEEGPRKQVERIDILQLRRGGTEMAAVFDREGGCPDNLRRGRPPDGEGAGELVHLAANPGCRAVHADRNVDEGALLDRELRIEAQGAERLGDFRPFQGAGGRQADERHRPGER